MLRITISKPGESSRTASFEKREITIGRTPANDLVIPEPGVSSAHARILYAGADITLVDLESTNGTFVNGTRIQGPHILSPSDEVFICAHRLEFELEAAGQQASTPGWPPAPTTSLGKPTGSQPAAPMSAPPPMSPAGFDGPPPLAFDGPPPLQAPPPIPPSSPPVGGSGARRAPDEPPTLPPPIFSTPLGDAVQLGGAPDPSMPPPVVAPIDGSFAPARTGSTISPNQTGSYGAEPSMVGLPPEPAASLEPVPAVEPPQWQTPAGLSAPPSPPPPPMESPAFVPVVPASPMPVASVHATSVPPAELAPPSVPPPAPSVPPPAPSMPPPVPVVPASAQPSTPPPPPMPPSNGVPVAVPTASSPSRSGRPSTIAPVASPVVASAGFARSSPSQPVLVDQGDGQLVIESDDLASITGPALARAVCARVFAAVHELLAPDGVLPERDADARARARAEAVRLLNGVADSHAGIEVRPWAERIASELCGLGALSARLAEPDVLEIFVHGPDRVLVRRGAAPPTEIDARFSCPQAIEVVVQRLTGTHFGPENPVVDARTLDGADVYAVHDSVATGGPVVVISLPSPSEPRHTLESLLGEQCISPVIANLLATCVQAGLGILVCAGPSARAFPIVSALVDAAPPGDRHVLVRPMSEPGLLPSSVVVLEGDGLVGTDGTTVMQALVRTAVGLRPDRLTVHDVGGAECVDVLAAIGHGLVGTVLSARASSARDGVQRLATLLGLAGGPADATARAAYVAQSIDLVVVVARFPDGRTRVVEVAEALVGPDGVPTTVEILGIDRTTGAWVRSGAQPSFFAAMQRRGIAVDGLLG